MSNKKRLLVFGLVSIMIFSLVACGGNEDVEEPEDAVVDDAGEEVEEETEETSTAEGLYHGFGLANLPRQDQGEDDNEEGIYSFNQVMVNALFDGEGRIVEIFIDQLEVGTPNSKGEGPVFNGFPEQGGYAGKEDTYENFEEELSNWVTKRERGEDYQMESGTWAEQMDKYEEIFVGKTYDEIIEWKNKNLSDLNNKPVSADSESVVDQEKYEKLSDEEKEELDDLTSVATMSLNDSHGNILIAMKNAYDNRVEVEADSLSGLGTAFVVTPRKGPGEDVYSFNEVFANTVIDADGKIAAIYVDQLEVTTPQEGKEESIYSGFPGQSDGLASEGSMREEISNWLTKREMGDDYQMESGSWEEQMNAIQEALIGMTKEEVKEWAENYDADAVSGATMTIEGESGDIIGAILKSFENIKEIDVDVK